MQVHHFYYGLTRTTRILLDPSTGGALMSKSANEAYQLLEDMALNNYLWLNERETPKKSSGVHELDVFNNLGSTFRCLQRNISPLNYKMPKLRKM